MFILFFQRKIRSILEVILNNSAWRSVFVKLGCFKQINLIWILREILHNISDFSDILCVSIERILPLIQEVSHDCDIRIFRNIFR